MATRVSRVPVGVLLQSITKGLQMADLLLVSGRTLRGQILPVASPGPLQRHHLAAADPSRIYRKRKLGVIALAIVLQVLDESSALRTVKSMPMFVDEVLDVDGRLDRLLLVPRRRRLASPQVVQHLPYVHVADKEPRQVSTDDRMDDARIHRE